MESSNGEVPNSSRPNKNERTVPEFTKGLALILFSLALILLATTKTGPLGESSEGRFVSYFLGTFAGVCGLDVIRRS